MAAYAALVSLMNIIHDIQHHPSPPISIHQQQLQSLTQSLTSLLQFLETSKSPVSDDDEADPFEMSIADAAYAAEDVIESCLVEAIHLTRTHHQQTSSAASKSMNLYQDLQRVIDKMDLLTARSHNVSASDSPLTSSDAAEDVMESHSMEIADDTQNKSINFHDLQRVIGEVDGIIKKMPEEMHTDEAEAVHARDVSAPAPPSTSSSSYSSSVMAGSDDVLKGLMEKVFEDRRDRLVIPIVGMGGIGKTHLASNIYQHKTIKEHFVVRAMTTISQKYNMNEILRDVLAQATNKKKEDISDGSEAELGTKLYKCLFGRRYLIVMDDMWSIDVWERIQHYFPNNENGNRILVTTRLSELSSQLNPSYSHQMKFLDVHSSRNLFFKIVFGEGSCPLELQEIGEKIVENCRGLPLSIVVVGGLLKKESPTQKCWESVRDNLTSKVNSDNNKHCLRLLKLSYNHLPVYLKPCFLYMGVLEEDDEIKVSTIIKLWVSEGFLKPVDDASLETIARRYLKDLVDRNLILIDRTGYSGNIKSCKIHDLLRDLCLSEGEKEGFHHVIGRSQGKNRQCPRVFIPRNSSEKKVHEGLQSTPRVRSIICENGKVPGCQDFELLRTFHAYKFRTIDDKSYINSATFQSVNLRHLAVEVDNRSSLFSSLDLYWNLHTLIVSSLNNIESTAPAEIWKMRQFRHIEFPVSWVSLPDPPSSTNEDAVVMENLQVIKGVKNFKCSEEVVKRIPNIKKLRTRYFGWEEAILRFDEGVVSLHDNYCLSNFKNLSKLEHLDISCDREALDALYLYMLNFPESLKTLNLSVNSQFDWEGMLEEIGSLPNLEKLKLWSGCFKSGRWEMVEGQFQKLKYLGMFAVFGLKEWIVEDYSALPCLEQLTLLAVRDLEEFPTEIGNIVTLKQVMVGPCKESVGWSVKEMVEEQVEMQGDLSFRVQIKLEEKNEELQLLSTDYFTVHV